MHYLQKPGHELLVRNWQTKFYEIDIVTKKSDALYFTEVKYRKKADQGGDLAAITAVKLHQMKFAAEYFVLKNKQTGADLRPSVVAVQGQPPEVVSYLELE